MSSTPPIDISRFTSITHDSRNVTKGGLFVALAGQKVDGTAFIGEAEKKGAAAVLVEETKNIPPTTIDIIRVKNIRLAMAQLAARYYTGQPSHMVAVTGTDGKTSTADFYRQFMHLLGKRSASIGTLGWIGGDGKKLSGSSHTTPDPIILHQELAALAKQGITHACLEASSHGLHQYRLHGVKLSAAAFTNLARDHMDYHHSEENYFLAKAMLFDEVLPQGGIAVVNADDTHAARLKDICNTRKQTVIEFGTQAKDLKILSVTPHISGQTLGAELMGKQYEIKIPMVGYFQVMNILCAMGLAMGSDELTVDELVPLIAELQGVPGRLELAVEQDKKAVYVDYAHTPAALANVLATIRPHTQNKLHVVLGCGGDRDAGKRPQMGKVASELADVIWVTDDNPRSEDAGSIRKQIMAECQRAHEMQDRQEAIRHAMEQLQAGDVLVIAGKGHEKTQIINGVEYPHDDVEVARQIMKEMTC